ncbi:DUF2304 domain-containing protein [Planctomycetaceae bacterium SH139]
MNLFQLLTIPILALLAVLEIRAYLRNHQPIHLLREVVWLVGIAIILLPSVTTRIATWMGIGRGTDLVFYAFMLLSTGAMFYLYGRNYVLRRDLVELVRRDALRGPTAGVGLADNNGKMSSSSHSEMGGGS